MKRYLLTLFVILSFVSCDKEKISSVQADNFIKYYTNFPEISAADVVTTGTSGYAILGTAKTAEKGNQICLIRTDVFGNAIDSARLYGRLDNDKAYCLKVLQDGGFAILGSSENPVSHKLEVYFIRTNSVGDSLWGRIITRRGNIEAKYFEVSNQGSFYMTGYCDSLGKGREIWWFGLDSEGNNIRNQRTYGLSNNDEGSFLQIMPDGRLIITGYLTKTGITSEFIIKTDENTVFSDIYEMPTSVNEEGCCVRIIDNDNFLLLGTVRDASGSAISLRKVKMSSSQHIINWSQTYNNTINDIGKSLIVGDINIYILGMANISGSNQAISIATTDVQGNQTNYTEFGLGSQLSPSSFVRTADKGFIIVGTNTHAEENNTSVALIKTDAKIEL